MNGCCYRNKTVEINASDVFNNYTRLYDEDEPPPPARWFTDQLDTRAAHKWLINYWHYSILVAFGYAIVIGLIKKWIKNKQRYELKRSLVAWNTFLAIFSLAATLQLVPELVEALSVKGFQDTICDTTIMDATNTSSGFWLTLYPFSKALELGDTLFIVFRKQPLTFLHSYHHSMVLIYSWYSAAERVATGRWFCVMNYAAHALMYSYYALKAARVKVHLSIGMLITTAQLVQMVIGCYVNVSAWRELMTGNGGCHVTGSNLLVSFFLYASHFYLFARFFYKAYLAPRRTVKKIQ